MESECARGLYLEMLKIRLVEERIVELYPEQEMRCPVHISIGQEAVSAGVSLHLTKDDYVMSGHRSHGHYLAKGGSIASMLAELYGKSTGCTGGKGGSMHLVDLSCGYLGATPIVGSTIAIAVGAAYGSMMRDEQRVTVVYFGDGATEEGIFHESLNFAVLKNLSIVFVCENNLYSVYSPLSVRQPDVRDIRELAAAHGVDSRQGDGNDVREVYELAGRAITRARKGDGPSFLEFKTYRWLEHCGPNYDNDIGYRTESEFLEWEKRDPLASFERLMINDDILDSISIEEMRDDLCVQIDEAVSFAKQSQFPSANELKKHVYSN